MKKTLITLSLALSSFSVFAVDVCVLDFTGHRYIVVCSNGEEFPYIKGRGLKPEMHKALTVKTLLERNYKMSSGDKNLFIKE